MREQCRAGKAFGHQKMALESTLRLHNDGAARRVSARIESGLQSCIYQLVGNLPARNLFYMAVSAS